MSVILGERRAYPPIIRDNGECPLQNSIRNSLSSALILSASLSTVSFANPITQRIVGGAPILMDSAPSIVALIDAPLLASSGSTFISQFCAGTVIADRWVLTAAHCVTFDGVEIAPSDLKILANSHDLNNPSEVAMDVSQIIIHDEYSSAALSHDVALIELTEPTSAPITPIAIVEPELNERLLVAGWGARQHTEGEGSFDFPSTLHAVDVLALPGEMCNTLSAYQGLVDETMICAGFPDGLNDHCHGDSGGPLYQSDEAGSLKVAGIISWAIGCGLEGRPGVYANVPHFQDWISSRIIATTAPADDETPVAGGSASEQAVVNIPSNDDGDLAAVVAQNSGSSGSGSSSRMLLGLLLGIFLIRRLRRWIPAT